MSRFITRRRALVAGAASGGLLLAGCDQITNNASVQRVLAAASAWTMISQRLLLSGGQLAREYKSSDIAPVFKANGTLDPGYPEYDDQVAQNFADWRVVIDGLVDRPLSLSIADLRALPSRTQITRHDCVEGWSVIGQWTGVQLGLLLKSAGLKPGARYAVFHCADNLDGEPAKGGIQSPGQYYESIGMADAVHPQTLLAYALNGKPLEVANGAPVRLRAERLLGYKQAKYVQRVQITDALGGVGGGKGGYWEDRGYDWYAGI